MYEPAGVLYEGARSLVTRVRRTSDRRAFVVKQLRGAFPSDRDLARFRREYEMLDAVGGTAAPRAVAFEVHDGIAQIVMDDTESVTLGTWLAMHRPDVAARVALAVRITEAIAHVHDRGVIHRDVNPSNLVVSLATGDVQLVDFGLASRIVHGVASPRPLAFIEGTPAYLAPEQTGRMNRTVDARADLYALGATLYELFAGHPPFVCADLLEYVHAHLAREPVALSVAAPAVPPSVASVVTTLLRKRPEERYQSAAGVALDLRRCLAAVEQGDGARAIDLASVSLCTHLEFPQALHGRDGDLARLVAMLDEVVAGSRGVVLVSGEPGIGKTSLAFELNRPATVAGARLLLGKFDQFTRDVPFAALAQGLESFFRDVLSEPHAAVLEWRERILAAIAPNAKLLTDMVPGARDLLGEQPVVGTLDPNESEQRVQETLRRTLRAIARPGHAAVLFLDDLHWADLASLRLIETLFRDPDLAHLLLVGAWRDTGPGHGHALGPTLDAVRASGTRVESLHLGPLGPADVARVLAGALGAPSGSAGEIDELAAVLHAKTRGNPFFLRRLVEDLGTTGALGFDRDALAWRFDLAAIRARAVTDNVVSFLRHDLEALSDDARRCLSAAAWIGALFDLELLRAATDLGPARLSTALRDAVERRFVVPLDDDYGDLSIAGDSAPRRVFAFVHDRIQQAASELLSASETARTRLAIARAMRSTRTSGPTDGELFRLAEHYNAAIALVVDADERAAVVALDLAAGRRAMDSAAYGPAHHLLEAAIAIAGPAAWLRDEVAAREMHLLAARAAWLVGDHALVHARVDELLAHAGTPAQRLRAEWVRIQAQIARSELQEGITAALRALASVGVALPREPSLGDVVDGLGAALGAIGSRTPDDLAVLPPLDDALEEAVRELLVGISSASYVATPNLLPLLGATLVVRSVARGVSRESSYGFGVFALSLCAGWHLALGYEYGRLALRLLARLPDAALGGRTRHVVNHFVRPWTEPLRDIHAEAPDLARALMDVGDLEYAAWVLHAQTVYGYASGAPLATQSANVERALATMTQHRLDAAYACTIHFAWLIRGLRGDPNGGSTAIDDEVATIARYRATGFRAAALVMAVCMLTARVIFGDMPGALAAAQLVFEFHDGAVSITYQCSMRVLAAIAQLSCLDALDPEVRAERIATVRTWRVQVAAAAERAPGNARHLLALFDAELARAEGDLASAITHFDEAVAHAAANGFVHDEALANERAGLFHLARGSRTVARAYLLEARFAWQRWGAAIKVAHIDALHGELLAISVRDGAASTTLDAFGDTAGTSLDLDTILKASQAISSEVDLDRLLTRAMAILLENVGARKAVLLLRSRGELVIEAVAVSDGAPTELLHGAALEDGGLVPASIVRRVWRRGLAEVHDDVTALPGATSDPYVQRVRPRSVLCAPVQNQGRAMGVLYFENELSAGAFTAARVRVLDVLAPQFAISIENARLHAAQDRFVPYQFLRSLSRDDIVDVEIGDHVSKEVSVFFSDIRGFTPLVEQLPAAEALAFINSYYAVTEPAIQGNGGFVDTYLGDGIMALFDAPDTNADDAIAAAVAMNRGLVHFNARRREQGLAPVRTGIGINTGTVMLATLGGGRSLKCGVVGDAVNLASRVEGLTRRYDAGVLVSESTRRRLRAPERFALRRVGRVRVVGRQQALTLYEVLDAEPDAVRDARCRTLERHEAAVDAFFAGDFETAREGFEACVHEDASDPLPRHFLARIDAAMLEPRGPGWDGVETLREK